MERPIIILSGGFDPYHDGHAAMFKEAARIGDIAVIINSDEWLINKKGAYFMSAAARSDVILSIKGVTRVFFSKSLTDVSEDIARIATQNSFVGAQPLIFGNGGDRTAGNTPEQEVCQRLGIPVIFGLGGGKANSSSVLLKRWVEIYDDNTDISAVYSVQ